MNDDSAAFKLMETGVLVEFKVMHTDIQPSLDGESLTVQVDLRLAADDDEDEFAAEGTVEWGLRPYVRPGDSGVCRRHTTRTIDYVKRSR